MELSQHAERRLRQRGISRQIVDVIMRYGVPTPRPGDAVEYQLTRKDKAEIIGELKRMIQKFDSIKGQRVLVRFEEGSDPMIITVYHATR